MLYAAMTKKALKLCFDAHLGQTDKGCLPYVFHPYHLAEQMRDESTAIVALLHDVVEDANISLDELKDTGFSQEVLDALTMLTHDKSVPYMEYIAALRDNPVAKTVKLADLRHNSDLTRLDVITPLYRKRVRKYRIAQAILEDDEYDRSCKHYVKRLPLDDIESCHLTIYYTGAGVREFSFDIESASDTHYVFSAESGEIIRSVLDSSVSLPEALSEFMLGRAEPEFLDLLNKNDIRYATFHFD